MFVSMDREPWHELVGRIASKATGEEFIQFVPGCLPSTRKDNGRDITRVTFNGHGSKTHFGSNSETANNGYTPAEMAQIILRLPSSVTVVDLLGCNVGLAHSGGPSYVAQVSELVHQRGRNIQIRGILADASPAHQHMLGFSQPNFDLTSVGVQYSLYSQEQYQEYLEATTQEIRSLRSAHSQKKLLIYQEKEKLTPGLSSVQSAPIQNKISGLENEIKTLDQKMGDIRKAQADQKAGNPSILLRESNLRGALDKDISLVTPFDAERQRKTIQLQTKHAQLKQLADQLSQYKNKDKIKELKDIINKNKERLDKYKETLETLNDKLTDVTAKVSGLSEEPVDPYSPTASAESAQREQMESEKVALESKVANLNAKSRQLRGEQTRLKQELAEEKNKPVDESKRTDITTQFTALEREIATLGHQKAQLDSQAEAYKKANTREHVVAMDDSEDSKAERKSTKRKAQTKEGEKSKAARGDDDAIAPEVDVLHAPKIPSAPQDSLTHAASSTLDSDSPSEDNPSPDIETPKPH